MAQVVNRTLEPAPGMKSKAVGLFLWQLEDQSRRLTEDTRGLTPEELEWQPAPGMNTIGMLLAHIALVEAGWIGAAALGMDWAKIDVLPVKWPDSGIPLRSLIVPDRREAVEAAILDPAGDLILVSGGSSVGAEDHAPMVVAERGELLVHGVAMRPSSPAGMGRIGERLVFLLPGNPVSCLCAYDFFAGPAIRLLGGRSLDWPHRQLRVRLASKISSAVGRVDYVRVRLSDAGVEPLAISGASILSSTTRADGFVIVPKDSEGHAAGEAVTVFLYD